MTPRAQKLVELTKELVDLIPAFPGTPQGEKFAKIQAEVEKISQTLTPAEMQEVNDTLGIFFED